jgi:hypothetical protein
MSIQFRTRSQTIVDYSRYITDNNITGCCYVYSSNTNSVSKTADITVSDCNQQNGHFIAGECDANTDITPSSTGCCCACSLGSPTVTTLCECESLSGLWTLGSTCQESEETLCVSGTIQQSNVLDYRETRACCYPEFNDDGTVYANCVDVCSEKECAAKAVYPYTATFYNNGRKCNEQVGSASPASDECKLSETNNTVMNSCENGTNVFCWGLPGYINVCNNKKWFDDNYAGKFAQGINQTVFQVRNKNNQIAFDLILGPNFQSIGGPPFAQTTTSIGVTKVCPGGYSQDYTIEEPARWSDGYFAILDQNSIPRYYATTAFKNRFADNSRNSPVPLTNIPDLPALDLIASMTFSAYIDANNNVVIYGRFFDVKNNQFKTLNVTQKLKKLYQHNVYPAPKSAGNGTDNIQINFATLGFVGQKLDNSFEYYSPFINDLPELRDLRNMIRSLPPKEFVKASLGANTFCGIDENGTMTCNSLNTELTYPLSKKYKLVSCSNVNDVSPDNQNPANDYCFAVDESNRIIKIASNISDFEKQPLVSYTDVIDLSCVHSGCYAVVEPDMDICNNQMNGSCCTCAVDITNCIQTNQGNCTRLGGLFRTGGICCNLDNPVEGCVDCNTVVGGNCGNNLTLRITQAENTLPESELTYYQDGLYVGVFEPGVPINTQGSTVNGNPYTGSAVEYIPNVVGYGTTTKRWAIIIAPNDYDLGSINDASEPTEVIPASMYDGLWNTYGDNQTYYGIQSKTMETLREDSKLSGWYVPSKNELEFINSKLNQGFFIPEVFRSMKTGIYLTSTPYFERQSVTTYNLDSQIFNGQSFMVGQSYSKSDYGSIYLVPRTSQVNVRLIRRIELE